MNKEIILGAFISLISSVTVLVIQTFFSYFADEKKSKEELLHKLWEQKVLAYRELNKNLVVIQNKIFYPEKGWLGTDQSDYVNLNLLEDFRILWNNYLDNEIFFSKDIKDIFLQIGSGVIGIEKMIKNVGENIDEIDGKIMEQKVIGIFDNIVDCHKIIKKDIGLDKLEKI